MKTAKVGCIKDVKVGDFVKRIAGKTMIYPKGQVFEVIATAEYPMAVRSAQGNDFALDPDSPLWEIVPVREARQTMIYNKLVESMSKVYGIGKDFKEIPGADADDIGLVSDDIYVWWHRKHGIQVDSEYPSDKRLKKAVPIFGEMLAEIADEIGDLAHLVEIHEGLVLEFDIYEPADEEEDGECEDCPEGSPCGCHCGD